MARGFRATLIPIFFTLFLSLVVLPATGCDGSAETNHRPLYIFAVCGDNRTEGIDNGVLPRIIESAKSRGAAFMVDTGDISSGGKSDAWASIIGATYFSFDYAGDHFVVVDNADDRTGIDAEQLRWLDTDLAANAGKPRQFIFAHIHVYLAYRVDGLDAYVTGGAGAPLYFPESSGGYFHCLLVGVWPDRVDVEVVRV